MLVPETKEIRPDGVNVTSKYALVIKILRLCC